MFFEDQFVMQTPGSHVIVHFLLLSSFLEKDASSMYVCMYVCMYHDRLI